MTNALSIDLEEWFCVGNLRHAIQYNEWDRCESRVIRSTEQLLDLFERHGVRATFFVLGWVAERMPGLIRSIDRAGHEIASHGYSHAPLTEMTPESFEADLRRAIDVTQPCSSHPIIGYRAPSFTVTPRTLWALDVMKRHGIHYDSSIFPVGFHPDYGIPGASLEIHTLPSGLIEVPMSCAEIGGRRVPCSGGGYFRLFPYPLTRHLMRMCNRQGRPVIFYLHPWEVDPDQPRVPLPFTRRLRHYHNLRATMPRLERMLGELPFTTMRDLLGL